MKKIKLSVFLIIISLFFLAEIGVAVTSEQTTALQTKLELIAKLTQQIQVLREKINALQGQLGQLKAEKQTNVAELKDLLKEGDRGENVKILQALLAADSEIYPEGLITGYYGPLTARAVKKFQLKNGLDQVGNVGPQTLGKLKQKLAENPIAFETSTDGGDLNPCAIVPPGHFIAPGWLKKQDGVRPIVPACQVLPYGIEKKLSTATSTTPTTTPDSVPPVISSVFATNTLATTTNIIWTTNEAATSKVYYGTSSSLNLASAVFVSDDSLVASHSLILTGLTANTTYYFVVESKDASNNLATSSEQSFTTLP